MQRIICLLTGHRREAHLTRLVDTTGKTLGTYYDYGCDRCHR